MRVATGRMLVAALRRSRTGLGRCLQIHTGDHCMHPIEKSCTLRASSEAFLIAGDARADYELSLQAMRLGVEVTTCTAARTGVGYYTEHLVDALLQTRGPGDEVVLLSNRPPAPELAARWSPYLHVQGVGVRALWMQTEVPRLLSQLGVDLAVFPNYAVPLASPCPTIVVLHDLALLRTPHHFTLRKRALLAPTIRQSVASAA